MSIDNSYLFPVYIYHEILEKIIELSKASKLEIFGYLVGNILKWNNVKYIIIEEQLFINNATHSDRFSTFQIEGTAGQYEKKFQELKIHKKNDRLRIVGWWHSHPDLGCFLSRTDLHTQEVFFPESYQVALVVDPIRDDFQFFTLEKSLEARYKSLSYAIISSK